MNEKELCGQRLLSLVKAAMWETMPDTSLFEGMEVQPWGDVLNMAGRQCVTAIAFDGVMRLPAGLQPPRSLKLLWGASVGNIELRYEHRKEALYELAALFGEHGIQLLALKGVGLSFNHPVPSHREFGDLDIYLFDRHDEGDRLLSGFGAEDTKHHSYKHTGFRYKGILIENHACLLNIRTSSQTLALNKRLMKIADRDRKEAPMGKPLFPSPDFSALFFMCHALAHFVSGQANLRFFCDWALLLHAYKGKWDVQRYHQALEEAGCIKVVDALTSLTVRYMGLNPEYAPPYKSDEPFEDKLWDEIMNPPPLLSKENRTPWMVFFYKCKKIGKCYPRHRMVYPGRYLNKLWHSFCFHIQHPSTIWKLG